VWQGHEDDDQVEADVGDRPTEVDGSDGNAFCACYGDIPGGLDRYAVEDDTEQL
jgi:hypothetical protein